MAQTLKWTGIVVGGALLAAVLILCAVLEWLRAEDPIASAQRMVPEFTLAERTDVLIDKGGEHRVLSDITLAAPGEMPVRFTISLPETPPDEVLPLQIVIGGLRAGRENIERLPAPIGDNAVIAFEYPERDAIRDKTRSVPGRVLSIRNGAMATPRQLVAILRWASEQPWADAKRMSLLGYSLGSFFVPVTLEAARTNGIEPGPTILAFGGADVGEIVPVALKIHSPVLKWVVGLLAGAVLHPVEPSHFLPRMKTETLLINAEADEMIPPDSTRLMIELTPEPKWVVTMPGDHIDPRDPVVLAQVVDITWTWLIERGAANAPPD